MCKVFVEQLGSNTYLELIKKGISWIGKEELFKPGTRVIIKPNLVWKEHTPGITTTPDAIRDLVKYLVEKGTHVTICESNGGQDCFFAEEGFQTHGLYDLEKEFGIKIVNLSKEKSEIVRVPIAGKMVEIDIPSILVHETDVFITMPVPKMHLLTDVSLAMKNQWGCLGNSMRITKHPQFSEMILAINKILKPIVVCDGDYFLDKTGPLVGEPVHKDIVLISDDVGGACYALCEIMQFNYRRIPHFLVAQQEGMFPLTLQDIEFNRELDGYKDRVFEIRRSAINYIQVAAFRYKFVNRFFYDSVFAAATHQILWFIRKNRFISGFLYGKYGPWEARRFGGYAGTDNRGSKKPGE